MAGRFQCLTSDCRRKTYSSTFQFPDAPCSGISERTHSPSSKLASRTPHPVPLLLLLCASDKSQVLQSRAGQSTAEQGRSRFPSESCQRSRCRGDVLPAGAAALRGRAGRWLTGFHTREVIAEVWAPGRSQGMHSTGRPKIRSGEEMLGTGLKGWTGHTHSHPKPRLRLLNQRLCTFSHTDKSGEHNSHSEISPTIRFSRQLTVL